MDNAAKALIMAGGVLIATLIISVSMYMYSTFQSAANRSNEILNFRQRSEFNSFFTDYPSVITGFDVYNICGKVADIHNKSRDGKIDYDVTVIVEPSNLFTVNAKPNETSSPIDFRRFFFWTERLEYKFDYEPRIGKTGMVETVIFKFKNT